MTISGADSGSREPNPQAVSALSGFDPGEGASEFVWGYLIAVANILHTHDEPTIAADVLGELMVERSVLKGMDLSDFDLEPLNQLFDELEHREKIQ